MTIDLDRLEKANRVIETFERKGTRLVMKAGKVAAKMTMISMRIAR